MKYDLKKVEQGFYQLSPLPTQEELEEYYEKKYYQNSGNLESSYSIEYKDFEIEYFYKKGAVCENIFIKFLNQQNLDKKTLKMLDIGCGEGFTSCYFLKQGWNVTACDFSSFGVEQFNKELLPYFIKGDIYKTLDKLIEENQKFDYINLGNVLEHVLNPELLVENIKKIMHKKSLLNIVVPNDYSILQKLLMDKKYIDKEYWFCPLDHISYFNFESLEKFLTSFDLRVVKKQASFATEIFAANNYSNYYTNPERGKQVHYARVHLETMIMNQGLDKFINYMEVSAEVGMTRNASLYVSLNGDN